MREVPCRSFDGEVYGAGGYRERFGATPRFR